MSYLGGNPHLIRVRELRAHLKQTLDEPKPRLIGTDYDVRALLIPLLPHPRWDRPALRQAIAQARRDFQTLLSVLEDM